VLAPSAALIIITGFLFFITFHVKVGQCVIKERLNWLFLMPKITDKGSDLLELIENLDTVPEASTLSYLIV